MDMFANMLQELARETSLKFIVSIKKEAVILNKMIKLKLRIKKEKGMQNIKMMK